MTTQGLLRIQILM